MTLHSESSEGTLPTPFLSGDTLCLLSTLFFHSIWVKGATWGRINKTYIASTSLLPFTA